MTVIRALPKARVRHIHLYLGTWIGFFALLAFLPVRYGRLEATAAMLSLLVWVALSVFAAYTVHFAFAGRAAFTALSINRLGRPLVERDLRGLIFLSIALAFVGLLALAYDRLAIQGIDFSQGIAAARQLWRRAGETRDGVSSIYSVLGYLLGFAFFIATTLAHLHWELISRHTRWHVLVWSTILILAHSLLAGGRSIVLVQLACIAATGAIRSLLGKPMMPGRGARIWLGVTLGMILAIGYSIYVFGVRAETEGILPQRYAQGMLHYLGAEPTESFHELAELPPTLATTAQFATVAGAYLTHSFGTFESMLDMQITPGKVTFGFIRDLLARAGIARPATAEWLLGGRFLSLPGSLWYDFGWLGFYAGALGVGGLIGALPVIIGLRGGGGIAICAALLILLTGLLAPLLPAIDSLSVPFLAFGFFLVDAVHRLWAGSTSWIAVGRRVRHARVEGAV